MRLRRVRINREGLVNFDDMLDVYRIITVHSRRPLKQKLKERKKARRELYKQAKHSQDWRAYRQLVQQMHNLEEQEYKRVAQVVCTHFDLDEDDLMTSQQSYMQD